MNVSRVRILAEIGLTVALSAVLSLIAIWHLPQGGSVSLVMLPILVLALLRGPAVGISAGALYGVIDYMIEPYFFHPVQVLLDYPVAYALVGLAGVFSLRWRALASEGRTGPALASAIVPAVALGSLGRYAAHVLSGLVFFASYAPEGQAPLLYSALYNSFVLISGALCGLLIVAVLPPLEEQIRRRSR